MSKQTTNQIVIEKYLLDISSKELNVSYLLISKDDKKTSLLKTIVLKSIEAFIIIEPLYNFQKIENDYEYELSSNQKKINIKITETTNEMNEVNFEVKLTGTLSDLDNFRTHFLLFLKKECKKIYCLNDQLSKELCIRAYPSLNELENIVREYLLRFFLKKVGSEWWKTNSSDDLKNKAKNYDNSRSFGDLLTLEIYNIDFIELETIITGNFFNIDDSRLMNWFRELESSKNNEEDFLKKINKYRNEVSNNWKKFFESIIDIKDFSTTWKTLYEKRCIISHNSLMKLSDFSTFMNQSETMIFKFRKLINEMDKKELSSLEKEQIKNIISKIDEINAMNFYFTKSNIEDIIKYKSITITQDNFFSYNFATFKEFKIEVENKRSEFEKLGQIEVFDFQGEEDNIPVCWINYKNIDKIVIDAFQHGYDNNLFKENT